MQRLLSTTSIEIETEILAGLVARYNILTENTYIKNQIREKLCLPQIAIIATLIARKEEQKLPGVESRVLHFLISELHDNPTWLTWEKIKDYCYKALFSDDENFAIPSFPSFLPPVTSKDWVNEFLNFLKVLTCGQVKPKITELLITTIGEELVNAIATVFSILHNDPDYAEKQISKGLTHLIHAHFSKNWIIDKRLIDAICTQPFSAEELGFLAKELCHYQLMENANTLSSEIAIPLAKYFKVFSFEKGDVNLVRGLLATFIKNIKLKEEPQKKFITSSAPLEYKTKNFAISARRLLHALLALTQISYQLPPSLCADAIKQLLQQLYLFEKKQTDQQLYLSSQNALNFFLLLYTVGQTFLLTDMADKDLKKLNDEFYKATQSLGETLFGTETYTGLLILINHSSNLQISAPAILHSPSSIAIKLANAICSLSSSFAEEEQTIKFLYTAASQCNQEELYKLAKLLEKMLSWKQFNTKETKQFVLENLNNIHTEDFLEIHIDSETSEDIYQLIPHVIEQYFQFVNPRLPGKKYSWPVSYLAGRESFFSPDEKKDNSSNEKSIHGRYNYSPSY